MAGTTYDKTKDVTIIGGVNHPGVNDVVIKIDFSELNVAAADDNWKVFTLQDGWILYDGYTRIPTASASTATVDVGTAEDGTELDAAIDISVAAADWTVMDTLVSGTPIIVTADGYIWLDMNTAAVTDGVLEIWLRILAAPGQDHDGI
jgi:hypothetical protein